MKKDGWVKTMVKNWLNILPANGSSIMIVEPLSYEANVMRNRIIYRGEASEIEQFFKQAADAGDTVAQGRFWAAVPSNGLRIRKIHSGLPGTIVDILASIVVSDMLDIEISEPADYTKTWDEIVKENDLKEILKGAIQDALTVGDGAFKISYDTELTELPILEFFSGEQVSYKYARGRIKEVLFHTPYKVDNKTYELTEHYGINFIKYELKDSSGNDSALANVPELASLKDLTFSGDLMLAVPMMFYKSPKWKGRGRSIFDRKVDHFDALDESISQWQDSLRLGRIKRYIPNSMIPMNPETGKPIGPNPFDNQFIAVRGNMAETAKDTIITDQPKVDFEGMLATYVNALDLCLQGLISPSTLGIDVKKLDNAEAQREKEKATLYTRNEIITVLSKILPELVTVVLKAHMNRLEKPIVDVECEVGFGEYANPSFEAQVETVGKAATAQIMSIETQVSELYGDSKDDDWKAEEVSRIKNERGIAEMQEPSVVPGGFKPEVIVNGSTEHPADISGDGKLSDIVDEKKPAAAPKLGKK